MIQDTKVDEPGCATCPLYAPEGNHCYFLKLDAWSGKSECPPRKNWRTANTVCAKLEKRLSEVESELAKLKDQKNEKTDPNQGVTVRVWYGPDQGYRVSTIPSKVVQAEQLKESVEPESENIEHLYIIRERNNTSFFNPWLDLDNNDSDIDIARFGCMQHKINKLVDAINKLIKGKTNEHSK